MPTEAEFAAMKEAKRREKREKKRALLEARGEAPKPSKKQQRLQQEQEESAEPAAAEPAAAKPPSAAPPAGADEAPSASSGLVDKTIVCVECGVDFIFSVGEQQFFLSKGYANGKSRCADCTAAKKARFGEKAGKGSAALERAAKAVCKVCGQIGHMARDCKEAKCYNCGQTGHRSKDCPEPRLNQAGGGVCFKFQTGQCTRGDSCRFAHILEPAAG